jgi:hypothetical protein
MPRRISREELFEMVWTEPFVSLSKKFEISDVGLRKICKRFNIPLPKRGHWQRLRAGKADPKPLLPIADSNHDILLEEVERPLGQKIYPWTQRQLEIEKDPHINLVVPAKLRDPDPLIVSARNALNNPENKSWKFEGMREARESLDIIVQPKLISRALAIMDTFIKLLRARGHKIENQYRETYVIIKEERIQIQIKERSKIVTETGGHWPTRKFLPTGVLMFKMHGYYGNEWADGARKLEDQLANILARMETKVEELHEVWRQNRIRQDEEQEQQRLLAEARKRKENELEAFKNLMNQAKRWKRAQVLREYLSHMKARASSDGGASEEFKRWFEWATKKVDWFDPHVESGDELLSDVDRDQLTFNNSQATDE